MNNDKKETALITAIALLSDVGAPLTAEAIACLEYLETLIKEWNPRSGLTATNELPHLWENHIYDSLSLVPYIKRYTQDTPLWLDIGCGGGFPLLPCKTVLPELPVLALERTQKKVAYLRFAMAQLRLQETTLLHGAFPETLPRNTQPGVITARAVEKPEVWAKALVPLIEAGAVFLCQQPEVPDVLERMFHVEQIDDLWSQHGLRRGELRLIRA